MYNDAASVAYPTNAKPSEAGSRWRGGATKRASLRACAEARLSEVRIMGPPKSRRLFGERRSDEASEPSRLRGGET